MKGSPFYRADYTFITLPSVERDMHFCLPRSHCPGSTLPGIGTSLGSNTTRSTARWLVAAVVSTLGVASSAQAECVCPAIPPPLTALKQSGTAFIGSVQDVRKSPVKEGYNEVKFAILTRIKGFTDLRVNEIYVFTPSSTDECGYEFARDGDYVVFAQGNPAGLRTTACLGTVFLDNVQGEIDSLLKNIEPGN